MGSEMCIRDSIYTSVDLRISILVSDDTESRQAGLSGAKTVSRTVSVNSFFEQFDPSRAESSHVG